MDNMLSKTNLLILYHLRKKNVPINSKTLASLCDVSVNTIKNQITQLNTSLEENGCYILSKKSIGYSLVITDNNKYQSFIASLNFDPKRETYSNLLESYRIHYLVRRFLISSTYLNLNKIADDLFYSHSTILRDLNMAKNHLENYGLTIATKYNHGSYLTGNEWNKRLCLIAQHKLFKKLDMSYQETEISFINEFMLHTDIDQDIRNIFLHTLQDFPFYQISYMNVPKISNYVILCHTRAHLYDELNFTEKQISITKEHIVYQIAVNFMERVQAKFKFYFSELDYISCAMLLICFQSVTSINNQIVNASSYLAEAKEAIHFIENRYPAIKLINNKEFINDLAFSIYSLNYQILFDIFNDEEIFSHTKKYGHLTIELCLEFSKFYQMKHNIKLNKIYILHNYYLFNVAIDKIFTELSKPDLKVALISSYGLDYAKYNSFRVYKAFNRFIQLVTPLEYAALYSGQNLDEYDLIITDIPSSETSRYKLPPLLTVNFTDNLRHNKVINNYFNSLNTRNTLQIRAKNLLQGRIFSTNFSSKKKIFNYIAGQLAISDKADFIADLENREALISSQRKNKIVFLSTFEYYLPDPVILIIYNHIPFKWNNHKSQLFIFANFANINFDDSCALRYIVETLFTNSLDELYDSDGDKIQYLKKLLKC